MVWLDAHFSSLTAPPDITNSHGSLVIGHWSLVTGHWSLVRSQKSEVRGPRTPNPEPRTTNHEPRTTNHELRTKHQAPSTDLPPTAYRLPLEGDSHLLKRVASAKLLGFPGRASRLGGRSVILADSPYPPGEVGSSNSGQDGKAHRFPSLRYSGERG